LCASTAKIHGCKATNGLIAIECIGAATQNGSGEKEFWPAVNAALVDTKGMSVGSELATSSGRITPDSLLIEFQD
jgi:hypothetical protein